MNQNVFHETKTHGKLTFPYTVYICKIPEHFISYPLHWHDEMEIIYVRNGKGTITVQTTTHTVSSGDIIILPPQVVHSIEQFENDNMEYYNILFQFNLLNSSINDNCYEKYFKPLYNHTNTIQAHQPAGSELNLLLMPYISYLIDNIDKSYTEDELMVKSNLLAIMHYINQYCTPASSEELSLHDTYDKLKKVLMLINSNYDNDITIADASCICGFSTSHFMKLFKDLTGNSFSQYLKNFRLEIAAKHLEEGSNKIIEISQNTGFHNLSYFTRSFVKKYGITPSNYRSNFNKTT